MLSLAAHFTVAASVIINKADLNREQAVEITTYALAHGAGVLGEIPYDPVITQAQLASQSVVEFGDNPASDALRATWHRVIQHSTKE